MPTDQKPEVPTEAGSPAQTTPPIIEPVPSVWPGAFGLYKHSKEAVLFNIGTFLGLIGLSILVSIASGLLSGDRTFTADNMAYSSPRSSLLVTILVQLASVWLSAAIAYLMIMSVKRQKAAVGDTLREGGHVFLPFLGQSLLVGLISVASFLLFIIPAFFVIPRLSLAQYFLIEGKLGVMDAISASWNATKGNVGKFWGIVGFNILLVLLCLTLVGIPFAIYFGIMYQAAIPILYFYVKKQAPVVTSTAQSGPVNPVQ